MINFTMIGAPNRPQERKEQIRGPIANGMMRPRIREVVLRVAIYCGVSAAVASFRFARETFAEMGTSA